MRGPKRPPGETRAIVAQLIEGGLSYREISQRTGIAKSTVAYHARRIGIPADQRATRRYDWVRIQAANDTGKSMRECMKLFGFSRSAWSSAVKRGALVPRPWVTPIDDLLVDRRRRGRDHLKARLLNAGLKEHRCECCGITEWQGKPLSMQLHHINGDGLDNRLENLELLCANCHSQTPTYGAKGQRRLRLVAAAGSAPIPGRGVSDSSPRE